MNRRAWVLGAALFGGCGGEPTKPVVSPAAVPAKSGARVAPVTDDYFGDKVVDPYRWMEKQDAELIDWARQEDAVTRSELRSLPGYAKLLADTTAAVEAQVKVSRVDRVGDRIYYLKQGRGEEQASLYVRALAGGAEKRLIDPIATGNRGTTLDVYAVSPDNHLLVYALADAGSEEKTLHFLDLQTGKALPEVIDRVHYVYPTWSVDSKFVFFNRLKPGNEGADRFNDQTIYRHLPGTDPSKDVALLTAVGVGSEIGRQAMPVLSVTPGAPFAVAIVGTGVSPEAEFYVTPMAELTNSPSPKWTRVATRADAVEDCLQHGRDAWLETFKDAPRRKLVKVDLAHPGKTSPFVSEQGTVLTQLGVASDGIYTIRSFGDAYSLGFVPFDGGPSKELELPFAGTLSNLVTDPQAPGAIFEIESWTQPRQTFLATPKAVKPLSLAPDFPLDLTALTSETMDAIAPDGTKIPMTIVHRRDLPRDGSTPTIIEAYGAYGLSADPFFDPAIATFVLRGGAFVEVHVRGGGEFGEDWHLAGKGPTKPNTWRDFIAGVETLYKAGITSRAKSAGWGTSAGGVMIGRAVTERPDLLGAAIMSVPIVNALRFELTEGGPANIAEFGTATTPEGYRALREMDGYQHVVDGTRYPAVLLMGGANDHRVPLWMAAKMAARLQAATSSGKPIRLRVDFDGGHQSMGAAKSVAIAQKVDLQAFVLQVTGDPAFTKKN